MGESHAPDTRPAPSRPVAVTVALAAAVVVAAGATRLIPDDLRPYNFAAVGALALFAAARINLFAGVALALGSLLVSDAAMWVKNDYHPEHLPSPTIYACFALYAMLGWACLRRTESPLRIAGVTVAAGGAFFLITNFAEWARQAMPYGYSLAGLMDSYEMALPFYRGTVTGDLLFAGLFFGLYAVLVRAAAPAGKAAIVAEEVRV